MKKHSIILLLTCMVSFPLLAQKNLEQVLMDIESNNKTLQAQLQSLEARKLAFKSDIRLYNPNIEYDFLKGQPFSVGNQTDILVNQAFDFPTAYSRKKELASGQSTQAELDFLSGRQGILLEAKQTMFSLIYRYKLQQQIEERKAATEKLLQDFEKKLSTGDGNILDVNKAKLQLIEINKDYQLNTAQINQLLQHLSGLNGGLDISFTATHYPDELSLPRFEELFEEMKSLDPMWRFYELESSTAKKQVEVMKAMALPKLEAGYRYQGILGATFQGFHVGTTIPLWENKYRVRQKEAELSFAGLQRVDYQNDRYYWLKQKYEQYEKLASTLQEYREVLGTLNSIAYLDKALVLGHISTIEYFMESNYFYMAYTNYLQTENEYYQVMAELLRFRL
ncbi:TolC family protein [Cecembia calidifontis]|uniref:Outer membrane efflux protein n=1 Tax=Cecembia calidifontis TaxID=1187080 RepID=A0A4Q7PAN2_9BACT|nr:TolC family protein [Cecembia calidifontis]RZS97284.1 outer membrane efflux protein [Cecembia calidifontis]